MGNKNLYMLNAEYNDYDDIEDYFEDYIPDNEEQSKSAIYVPYIPEYINIQDIGLGMEIPVNSIDFSYSDKPIVRISNNEPLNIQRPNIRPKQTIQKQPQERIDYINKKRTDINPINNISQKNEEIVMIPKKKQSTKSNIDYQKMADRINQQMGEESQIKSTGRYSLLSETPKQNNKIFMNYEPMTLMGDKNYKAPNLYEKEKLQKENEILKKALEYEIKMKNRVDILYNSIKNEKDKIFKKINDKIINPITVPIFDEIIDKYYANDEKLKMVFKILFLQDAIENLDMAFEEHYLDTPFARQHTVLRNADEISPVIRNVVKERIKKQLTEDYGKNCVNTTKGIYFENNSEPSKRLAKSLAIKKYIQENKQYLKDYGYIKKGDISFTELNFWGAIGKAVIAEMYLEKTGEITFYLIDTYDFNKNGDYFLVKAGRLNQERGRLIPYFAVYSVKIDRETVFKYWKEH